MRYFVLLLLMTSMALAVDIKRIGSHTVDDNLTDTVNYVDYFYDDYANATANQIKGYNKETDYIKTRSGPMVISRWSITQSDNVLVLNVTGTYPGFVIKEGGRYKIDGKGFIDTLCVDYSSSYIGSIDQEFDFDIIVPERLAILSVPPNGSDDMEHLFYNLTVTVQGNTVHRSTRFTVKNATDIYTYCDERGRLDRLLKKGIIAKEYSGVDKSNLAWVLAVLVMLVLSLYYLVRK
jgi:hypothetical protein